MSSVRHVAIRTHRSLQGKMPQVGNAETLAGQIAAPSSAQNIPLPPQCARQAGALGTYIQAAQESWPQTLTLVILIQLLKTAPQALKPERKRGLDRSLPVASITLFKTINLASLCKTRSSIWENEISAVTDGSYTHFPQEAQRKGTWLPQFKLPGLLF